MKNLDVSDELVVAAFLALVALGFGCDSASILAARAGAAGGAAASAKCEYLTIDAGITPSAPSAAP